MCCSYCGKEIGAFRLLRDSEFCSAAHRQKYGERLSKTLHDIAAPEPPPAALAGFRDQMPLQRGNDAPALQVPLRLHLKDIHIPKLWTVTLDVSDPGVAHAEPAPAVQPAPSYPPMAETWMPAPYADPVEAFLKYSELAVPVRASRAPRFAAELKPTPVIDRVRYCLALCEAMQPVPAAEPVTAFVQASSRAIAIDTVAALRLGTLKSDPVIDRAAHAPAMATRWETLPAPELVASFVQASSVTDLVSLPHTLQLPHFTAELEPTPVLDTVVTPDPCTSWMAVPAAEPVAAFVQVSASLGAETIALRLPSLSATLHEALPLWEVAASIAAREPVTNDAPASAALTPTFTQAELQLATLAPATLPASRPAESVRWIARGADSELRAGTPSLAGSLPAVPAAPILPVPVFAAEIDPLPTLDELLDPPAMCEAFLPGPAPEPVFRYVQSSVAAAIEFSGTVTLPAALSFLVMPHVPRIRESQAAPFAEAVMAEVVPVTATAPMVFLRKSDVTLPVVPGQTPAEPFEAPMTATEGARPEAVESRLGAALSAIPISRHHAARATVLTAPGLFAPAPISSDFVAGPQATPLESSLAATVAVESPMARVLHFPILEAGASTEHGIPRSAAHQVTPALAEPAPAQPHYDEPQPVTTLSVVQPAPSEAALERHLPHDDIAPLEFHTARLRSDPVGRPEWISTRIALLPPQFTLLAALDKLEDPGIQPKPTQKVPELLNMPAAKRQPTVFMVAGRVAAAFLLASSLWYGITNFRSDRRLSTEDLASSGPAIGHAVPAGSAAAAAPGATAPAGPTGTIGWMKHAIAERASLKIAENFKSMDSWEGTEKAKPAGWKRHPDGYMNTGQMAIFTPTVKFTDYRMEFFGQIENKSIGWTVRAADTANYHAMKLSVVEAGTRPFVALVQYNVVGGKAGRQTRTPLNVMVHNNRPMQFAIDVKGSRYITSIDGEEVDSYTDTTLVAGGVGFFSETGERARLYWLRVSRNDDWLGHVCAMLADTVSTTALLRGPAGPADPLPGLPAGEDSLMLGAVWLGLPYLRNSRPAQFKKLSRSKPWNS